MKGDTSVAPDVLGVPTERECSRVLVAVVIYAGPVGRYRNHPSLKRLTLMRTPHGVVEQNCLE
jgi:hypothetical protein